MNNAANSEQPPVTPSSQTFNSIWIIKLLLWPIAMILLILVGIAMGWENALQNWLQPQLVPVTGEVRFQGKPLTVGVVSTRYLDGTGGTALGPLNEDGRFSLETNGIPGAFLGRHKVLILSMTQGFPPKSIVPEKYAQESATPLMIQVTSSKEKNHFSITLDEH